LDQPVALDQIAITMIATDAVEPIRLPHIASF
jgi:hypothetical protein